ncbi:MAG: YciI family protein [Flectobacillus sp.]|uniref:YciI family protein n=1 Tax=Flectobacillus sp. TaxID=50419 RepID=UPI003B9C2EC6
MFIIQLTYTKSLREVDNFLAEHKQYLQKYYDRDIFLLSGRKNPRTGGVILANAKDKAIIEQIITEDPFHKNGVAEYTIIEFLPTMAGNSLKHLI